MTLQQLAKITGYSKSTVSKAFSNSQDISDVARTEIIAKAKELGIYSKYSKVLCSKKIISVICPEVTSVRFSGMVSVLNEFIEKNNGIMIVSVTDSNEQKEEELIELLSSKRMSDGIIVLGGKLPAKKYLHIPIVYLDFPMENPYAVVFNFNIQAGMDEAIKCLSENGHDKIALIADKLTCRIKEPFVNAMEGCGIPVDERLVYVSERPSEDEGREIMDNIFESGVLPTAIVAGCNYIADGVIDSITKHGKSVPDDFSVITVDGIGIAKNSKILSSIELNVSDLCRLMVDSLFDKIENANKVMPKNVSADSRFIKRESVGRCEK